MVSSTRTKACPVRCAKRCTSAWRASVLPSERCSKRSAPCPADSALGDIKASIKDYYVAESHYPAKFGLARIVDEAFAGYPEKTELQTIVDAVYADPDVQVGDLDGAHLAEYANGRITLDIDAAGNGWFVDLTPQDDREFGGRGSVQVAGSGSAAAGRMDLLSVLAHEMGHALGLGHTDGGVMDELLRPGTRATPERWAAAAPATGETAAHAMVIDWGAMNAGPSSASARSDSEPTRRPAWAASTPDRDWRQRFVTDLGRSQEAANPNASLRVLVPVSASAGVVVKPRVSLL